MNKQTFNWFFGTIATIIVLATILGIIASKGNVHSAVFSLFGGLGGLAALGLARKAFSDFQKSEEARATADITIDQLEKLLVLFSPLHRLLRELPKFYISVTMEDGTGVRNTTFSDLRIKYGDLKNVLRGQIRAYNIFQIKFELVGEELKIFTSYNVKSKNYSSCEKMVEGDILAILESGEGSLTFLTGGELDEDRKEVLLRLSKEPVV